MLIDPDSAYTSSTLTAICTISNNARWPLQRLRAPKPVPVVSQRTAVSTNHCKPECMWHNASGQTGQAVVAGPVQSDGLDLFDSVCQCQCSCLHRPWASSGKSAARLACTAISSGLHVGPGNHRSRRPSDGKTSCAEVSKFASFPLMYFLAGKAILVFVLHLCMQATMMSMVMLMACPAVQAPMCHVRNVVAPQCGGSCQLSIMLLHECMS